jgi:hypothetical protein
MEFHDDGYVGSITPFARLFLGATYEILASIQYDDIMQSVMELKYCRL